MLKNLFQKLYDIRTLKTGPTKRPDDTMFAKSINGKLESEI